MDSAIDCKEQENKKKNNGNKNKNNNNDDNNNNNNSNINKLKRLWKNEKKSRRSFELWMKIAE